MSKRRRLQRCAGSVRATTTASAAKPVAWPEGKPMPLSPASADVIGRGLATTTFATVSTTPATAGATMQAADSCHDLRFDHTTPQGAHSPCSTGRYSARC